MVRRDRQERLQQWRSGSWGTISTDLICLVERLFKLSKADAAASEDGNLSKFVYAGIPLLLAALRSFIIEQESIGRLTPPPLEVDRDNLIELLRSRYGVTELLLEEVRLLGEIRNEIIHPNPLPPGTPDNWPAYLRKIKECGLLTSTGRPDGDYIMYGQIASHRLFVWAVRVTRETFQAIANSEAMRGKQVQGFVDNFDAFEG